MNILPPVQDVRPVVKLRTKTALILIASTLFANLIQDDTAVLFQEFIKLWKNHQFVLLSMIEIVKIWVFIKLKVWKSENQFYFCWIYFDFDIFNWYFDAEKTTINKSEYSTINGSRNCFTLPLSGVFRTHGARTPSHIIWPILTFGPYITLMCSKIKDPYFTLSDCDSDTWESRWNFSLIFWKRYRLFTKWSPFFFFRVGIFEFLNFKMLNDQLIIALSLVISFLFILNLILTIYLACFKRAIFGRPITISHRSANAELPGTNHGFVVERSEKS